MSGEADVQPSGPRLWRNSKMMHALSNGACSEYRGRAAKEAIIGRLTGWPEARRVATETCDFYGDSLQYHEDAALSSSHYAIELQHEPIALQYARIELQVGTPRTAEALLHELLHLNVPMRGHPLGEKFWIPGELLRYAHPISASYPIIGNLLEHELIIDIFLGLGFDKANFLGCLSPAPDYQHLASKVWPSLGCREEVGFSWWCLEYFRHWVSTRHWVGEEADIYADGALYWGSKVYPGLQDTAKQIRNLIESGAIRDSKQYPFHVNTLLRFMKVPQFTEWASIQTGGYGKPRAIRLTQKVDDSMSHHCSRLLDNRVAEAKH
jgi:hypothetical protein